MAIRSFIENGEECYAEYMPVNRIISMPQDELRERAGHGVLPTCKVDIVQCEICRHEQTFADVYCYFCEKRCCATCLEMCAGCNYPYCKNCSTTDYSQKYERTLCFDCLSDFTK